MMSIKLILVILSLLAAIFGSLVFRSKLGLRLLAICLFISATQFVIFPDAATSIAHFLGVGRGADLLLYLAFFAGIDGFLLLYLRTRRLEQKITEHIRSAAISNAQILGTATPVSDRHGQGLTGA